jgi:Nucleotide-diphospho-sugar transferase
MDVSRRLGFILCCGFMAFRPSPETNTFLDIWAGRTAMELDDQTALNHLVAKAGISGMDTIRGCRTFAAIGVRWVCPPKSDVSRNLAFGRVVRHFHQKGQTVAQLRTELGLGAVDTREERVGDET